MTLRLLAIVLFLALCPLTAGAAPKVLASIKPIHSLVAAVMAGIGTPELLLQGVTSPHSYSLRPSDARKLQAAEIIFWLGPDLEIFLARPLPALAPKAAKYDLIRVPGLKLLQAVDHHNDDHRQGATDMHIWLDPDNAAILVARITNLLQRADPANRAKYGANADTLKRRLKALGREITEQLAPVRHRTFMVFHNAFGYFQRRFQLQPAAVITDNPHQRPGAGRMRKLRTKLQASAARCVFREPQFNSRLVNTLTEGHKTKIGTLDPIGSTIPPGPGHYFTLLRAMSSAVKTCLSD